MPIIPLKCPSCGAQLQADSDSAILTCKYCGTNSVMKDAIVQNYIQNTVNINAATVNVCSQKDFVIRGGVLEKYCGESVDVVIPNNVTAIGWGVFEGLQIKSVVIPNGVREMSGDVFKNCTALTSVKIPNSLAKIGFGAFWGCTALKSVTLPDGIKEIEDLAFNNCTSLASVTLPASLTRISGCAFADCTALKSITIPKSVESILHAFGGCPALKSVTILNDKTHIGTDAFKKYEYGEYIAEKNAEKAKYIAEKNRKIAEARRRDGKCQHCGGSFKGIFKSVCSSCGREKDY